MKIDEERYATIEEIFEHKGFKCIIVFNEIKPPKKLKFIISKWRCGYVGVTKKHPLYKKDYSRFEDYIFAHGGLTFSDFGSGKALPKDNLWWIGFDCQHYRDTIKNWTFERVKKEVEELAEQLTIKNLILAKLENENKRHTI